MTKKELNQKIIELEKKLQYNKELSNEQTDTINGNFRKAELITNLLLTKLGYQVKEEDYIDEVPEYPFPYTNLSMKKVIKQRLILVPIKKEKTGRSKSRK